MSYQPTFESVKTHPLPDWYNDAKLGIFIHWGLYSVPAFAPRGEHYAEKLMKGELSFANTPYAEWYQNSLRIPGSPTQRYHNEKYGKDFTYKQFALLFNQALADWNPDQMADLFALAGARYVVLVSKHHDGFLMWNSRHPNPYLPAYQTKRDVAGKLNKAVSERGMKMGFYYSSLLDWTFTHRPITNDAELVAGSPHGREGQEVGWFAAHELPALATPPADAALVRWEESLPALADCRPGFVRRYWAKRDRRAGLLR